MCFVRLLDDLVTPYVFFSNQKTLDRQYIYKCWINDWEWSLKFWTEVQNKLITNKKGTKQREWAYKIYFFNAYKETKDLLQSTNPNT